MSTQVWDLVYGEKRQLFMAVDKAVIMRDAIFALLQARHNGNIPLGVPKPYVEERTLYAARVTGRNVAPIDDLDQAVTDWFDNANLGDMDDGFELAQFVDPAASGSRNAGRRPVTLPAPAAAAIAARAGQSMFTPGQRGRVARARGVARVKATVASLGATEQAELVAAGLPPEMQAD